MRAGKCLKPVSPAKGEGKRERGKSVRRFVMFVRDNGPIISLGIGTTCVAAFAILTESMWHKLGFLALVLLGLGLMVGITWAKRHLIELSKPPDTGA
ncbi:MAG: hypothetical protein LZF86_160075 [Nitrospira sp.]|nr:MAG: hypothetical protein LZF86_160075 [Nitrospira sp.]